jgi:hypothetical protein
VLGRMAGVAPSCWTAGVVAPPAAAVKVAALPFPRLRLGDSRGGWRDLALTSSRRKQRAAIPGARLRGRAGLLARGWAACRLGRWLQSSIRSRGADQTCGARGRGKVAAVLNFEEVRQHRRARPSVHLACRGMQLL